MGTLYRYIHVSFTTVNIHGNLPVSMKISNILLSCIFESTVHVGYCSNKRICNNWGKAIFFASYIGGQ